MASGFLDAFAARANLTSLERTVLADSDVRSAEDVHSLMKSFPSIGQLGLRVSAVAEAAAQEASETFLSMTALPPNAFRGGAGSPPSLGTEVAAASNALMTGTFDRRVPGWDVRDQGGRDACVAFAATACVEYRMAAGGNAPDLSEQFLYWAIKKYVDPDKTHESTLLKYALGALKDYGICAENQWRYSSGVFDPVSGPDPDGQAIQAAAANRVTPIYKPSPIPGGAGAIYDQLKKDGGGPVAATFRRYGDPATPHGADNWTTDTAQSYGRVLSPPRITAEPRGNHTVCITGFRPEPGAPGGGYFIFRNSWGMRWGKWPGNGNSYAPEKGYGDVSVEYVNSDCVEILYL